jgi:hypothetical protein
MFDANKLREMQIRYLMQMIYVGDRADKPPLISGSVLEKDRRSRTKIVTAAHKEGYLASDTPTIGKKGEHDDYYTITRKVIESLPASDQTLFGLWRGLHIRHDHWDQRETWAFLRVGRYNTEEVPLGRMVDMIEEPHEYEWWVADTSPLTYRHTFNPDTHLAGPFTLPEARACFDKKGTGDKYEIVVSKADMRAQVAEFVFDAHVDAAMPSCLGHGLFWFGILTEPEAELIVTKAGGLLLSSPPEKVGVGEYPLAWGERLSKSLDTSVERMAQLAEKMRVIRKVEAGVAAYGGWDKFRTDLRARVFEEMKKCQSEAKQSA